MDFNELKTQLEQSGRNYDIELLERAYNFAKDAHGPQMRQSGEPYVTHPIYVASLLIELGLDNASLAAALLHDVVEDTDVTLEEVQHEFGSEIASLVDGVTKLGNIPFSSVEDQQAENLRKMLLAMSQDIRVMIIKLCDRLHNLRTLDSLPEQKQRDKALETMEYYAPIAHRLGMSNFKEELEDLSLKYLDPFGYNEIVGELKQNNKGESFINGIVEVITERLAELGIQDFTIESRLKSIYGIYRKLYIQNRSWEQIYDVYAVRVILNTVGDCYNVLGVLHDMYRPIPNRFKDYISTPKPNMYRSLHTTVIAKGGTPFEIQIRTYEMHYEAEYGIAAHWKYKVGISGKDRLEERLAWVRQLLESQKESEDAFDLVQSIKSDLLPEDVYVFTPKGDVINLPSGATVIDFAYAIHSAVGNRMMGAKVDGKMVPITYRVKTGEIVEVVLGPADKGPSRDWLSIVQTGEAKSKIRAWFKKERREENIEEGKATFERELRRHLISVPPAHQKEFVDELVKRHKLASANDLFASIGYGGLTMSRVLPKAKEIYGKMIKQEDPGEAFEVPITREKASGEGVIVEGLDNCLVKLARCCNPLPGDDIVGFITRGKGVTVHRADCMNVAAAHYLDENSPRWLNVRWADTVKEDYKATIELTTIDRNGMIAEITAQISNMRVPIFALKVKTTTDGRGYISVTLGIRNTEHLNTVIARLKKIKDVQTVERVNK